MMMTHHPLTQLRALRLDGMAHAFEAQRTVTANDSLSFEERRGLLVDREITWRDSKRLERLLKAARFKRATACLEDIDYRASRSRDRRLIASLAAGDWIRNAQNVILTGKTGCGKTWLACALGNQACRQGCSVQYVRLPRLFEELRVAHGDGSFGRRLAQLAKTDVVICDDWGLTPLDQAARPDLLELLDDRVRTRSTLVTRPLPVKHWHEYLADPTLADAILDRLVHQAHQVDLKGESLRKNKAADAVG